MRVMVFGKATKDTEAGTMPTAEAWAAMEKYQDDLAKAGIVVAGEGLMPSVNGARIRCAGKDRIVTNGPFVETREVIAGYSIWEVKSMDEAVAWAKRCPMTDDSEIELRPIFSFTAEEVSEITSQAK